MHKYIKVYELKCICKEQAQAIRKYKPEYQKTLKETMKMDWRESSPVWEAFRKKFPMNGLAMKKQYRLYHIAHCLLRGKTYDQIENKVREENKLKQHDWDEIEAIRQKYQEVPVAVEAI